MIDGRIILDLCGGTGAWSKPYADAGYDVRVITLPDYDVFHYEPPENVYGILAAPDCTMFSFARTRGNKVPRDLPEGMRLVEACMAIIWRCQYRLKNQYTQKPPLTFWALENPRGMLAWFHGKPVLEFDPYDYGDDYSKRTHVWGYFNVPPKQVFARSDKTKFDRRTMKELRTIRSIDHATWRNGKTRKMLRSITPPGFAEAFFEVNQ